MAIITKTAVPGKTNVVSTRAESDVLNLWAVTGKGQFHVFTNSGHDVINMGFKDPKGFANNNLNYSFHVYGGSGSDTFNLTGYDAISTTVVGRLDDFDPTNDKIQLNGVNIDLNNLDPSFARIVNYDGDRKDSAPGPQQWLLIKTQARGYLFFALEGARATDGDGHGGTNVGTHLGQEEYHFLPNMNNAKLDVLWKTPATYEAPFNFVPKQLYDYDAYINKVGNKDYREIPLHDGKGVETSNDVFDAKDSFIMGGSGHNLIHAGAGDDVIDGSRGKDTLYGDEGNDIIAGGLDNDTIEGGAGNDTSFGGDGADLLYGNAGNDALDGNKGNDSLYGGDGDDLLSGNQSDDYLDGGTGNDNLLGGIGTDVLQGGDGNDNLQGGAGGDRLMGGAGLDTADYSDSTTDLTIDLLRPKGSSGFAKGDSYEFVENLIGSRFGDILNGDGQNNEIRGGDGNDQLNGREGDDRVYGGEGDDRFYKGGKTGGGGSDVFWGGNGADQFIFGNANGKTNIVDFEHGRDKIVFRDYAGGMTGLKIKFDASNNTTLINYEDGQISLEGKHDHLFGASDFIF